MSYGLIGFNSRKLQFGLMFVLLLFGLLIVLGLPNHAQALDKNSYPENFRDYRGWREYLRNYNNGCAGSAEKYAIINWVSTQTNPGGALVVSVPYGTEVVQLQYNAGTFLCHDRLNGTAGQNSDDGLGLPVDSTVNSSLVALSQTFFRVEGSSVSPSDGGYLSPGGAPSGGEIEVGRNLGSRYWFGAPGFLAFDYVAPGPMLEDKTITINLLTTQANNFGGRWFCVGGSGSAPATSSNWRSVCPYSWIPFTITIDVADPPPPPPSSTQSNFTNISGRVFNNASGGGYANVVMREICSAMNMPAFNAGRGAGYIVDMATTPSGNGWWLLGYDGGVFSFGDAQFYGSAPGIGVGRNDFTGIGATPDGGGYALVTADGSVYNFGNSGYAGNQVPGAGLTMVGIAHHTNGSYWILRNDGAIYGMGAPYFGGGNVDAPGRRDFTGIAPRPDRGGYTLITNDGGQYNYNTGYINTGGNNNVVGIAQTPTGGGYYIIFNDGYIRGYGDAFKPRTNSDGYFTFPMAVGKAFCLRIESGIPGGLIGPTLNSDYPPGSTTYECQAAGQNQGWNGCGFDRAADNGFDFSYRPVPPPQPPSARCAITVTPNQPEKGTQFTVRYSILNNGEPGAPTLTNVRIEGAGISGGHANWGTIATNPSTLALGQTGFVERTATIASAGVYTITGSGFSNEVGPIACENTTLTVVALPYIRAYGGDVRVGDSLTISGTCGVVPVADIKAFNSGSTTNYAGAGGQAGVFATGVVEGTASDGKGFISAALNTSLAARPKGLTFANTGGTTYGGNFGGNMCLPDYYSKRPAATTAASGTMSITSLSGNQYINGNVTLTGSSVPNGHKLSLYVDGNVTISGAVSFAGPYASASDIPSIYIVATGNIYIDRGVSQVDGTYISENTIYTCSNGASAPPNGGWIAAECDDNRLRVNGALIAKNVKLHRVIDSVINAVAAEDSAASRAAEIFDLTPEFWLTSVLGGSESPGISTTYDSITNLPPIL